MNKFAIILPTIGRESLKEAIESVIAQSYPEWNLILSFDSHDAFAIFHEQHLLQGQHSFFVDKRIVYLSPGNSSLSNDSGAAARNYAMRFIPGDCNWVCYIDDDDTWYPHRLSSFNHFIDSSHEDLDLFYSYGDLFKMKHRSPRSSEMRLKRIGKVDNITCGGMCHKPELFKKTDGWNPNNLEDHDFELYDKMRVHSKYDHVLEESTFRFIWRK